MGSLVQTPTPPVTGGLPPSTQVAPPSVEYAKPWVLELVSKPSPSFQAATRALPCAATETSHCPENGLSPVRTLTIRSAGAAAARDPASGRKRLRGRGPGGSGGSAAGAGVRAAPTAGSGADRARFERAASRRAW